MLGAFTLYIIFMDLLFISKLQPTQEFLESFKHYRGESSIMLYRLLGLPNWPTLMKFRSKCIIMSIESFDTGLGFLDPLCIAGLSLLPKTSAFLLQRKKCFLLSVFCLMFVQLLEKKSYKRIITCPG